MKGFHKVGDSVLVRATIKRVDEGSLEEQLDPVTFESTGKFSGQALLDLDIPSLGIYTVAASCVVNEAAQDRLARKKAMDEIPDAIPAVNGSGVEPGDTSLPKSIDTVGSTPAVQNQTPVDAVKADQGIAGPKPSTSEAGVPAATAAKKSTKKVDI